MRAFIHHKLLFALPAILLTALVAEGANLSVDCNKALMRHASPRDIGARWPAGQEVARHYDESSW